MNIPENVLAYFQRVDSLIAFQNIFSSHGTSITITEWLQNDLRAMQSLNMFLSYRFEAYIEPTVKQWIKAEFSSKRSKTQFNWMKELQWHVLYRSFCLASLRDIVKEKVEELCEASFDSRISGDLHDWLTQELFPFIRAFFHETDDRVCSEMHNAAIVMMVEIRSSKLFEIIADYPDSMPCLIELHDHLYSSSASCATLPSIVPMIASQLLGRIGKRLRKTIESRLLHLGAATSQILDFYVSMIAALRIVDSSDALLNYSLSPVRTYLKQRKDAIRCIISSLTESKDSDLHSALRTGMSLAYGIDEDDEEGGPGTHWKPKQRNADLRAAGQAKGLDVLASLVSIYGSTDLFVAEFRQLLGEKLLNNLLYSTDEELTNVELLKIRFGEECLQSCEVMLKDIQDSKRVNTAIQSASQNNGHPCLVDMAIISEHYWPSFPRDGLTYHSLVQEHIDRYVETYANLKKPRKLRVAPQIGTVELELDFADGTVLTLQVPPLQANLICNFSDASTPISLADLAARCDIDESDAALAMKYWVSRGVVKEEITTIDDGYGGEMENHLYTIVENQAGLSRTARDDGSMELDQVNRLETLQQARLESTKAIVADYVKGLLTSHGSMGVDRLCSLLHFILMANTSLSAADYEFAVNIASLRQFLNVLVDKGMLEVVDGLFSLARG